MPKQDKHIVIQKPTSELLEKLQAEYTQKTGSRITPNAVLFKLLTKAKIENIL